MFSWLFQGKKVVHREHLPSQEGPLQEKGDDKNFPKDGFFIGSFLKAGDSFGCDGQNFTVVFQTGSDIFCLSEKGVATIKDISCVEQIEPMGGLSRLSQTLGMTSLYCLFDKNGSFHP
ncbi:hypothetical protein MAR_ORF297 [Marseillevirus marseillevirus]|uniref:Uncharacterized protein n=1 Tax=Marseillevirus marseillevirus TaxID=694581 RepID=D2XAU3_GBMV|nr:hypothetical protein MAR_ORF297 [Marseillevirus marseillevirus]ADB04070.1 hypothetical protein MAR_ORF297 [Marseillevirus marseillevirus]